MWILAQNDEECLQLFKKKNLESSREIRQLKGWKMTQLMPVAKSVKQHMLPSRREMPLLETLTLSVPVGND